MGFKNIGDVVVADRKIESVQSETRKMGVVMKVRKALVIFGALLAANAFAGDLFVAKGFSSRATPMGDQRKIIHEVIEAAKESALRELPSKGFFPVSDWEVSYFYSGSRIYGLAKRTFREPAE